MIGRMHLRLCLIILICVLNKKSSCQNIGFLFNSDFSMDKKVNVAIGGGFYCYWPAVNERIDFQLSAFRTINNNKTIKSDRDFTIEGIVSGYKKIGASASALYVLPFSNTAKFKLGPSVSYNFFRLTASGIGASFAAIQKLNSIGPGIKSNFNFKVKSQATFDIILDTSYLLKINESGSFPEKAKLNNSILFSLFIGLSYPF